MNGNGILEIVRYQNANGSSDSELEGGKKETNEEAVDLLLTIKSRFRGSPVIYENFLQIIRDLEHNRVKFAYTITRLYNLFKHDEFILMQLNKFLPNGTGFFRDTSDVNTDGVEEEKEAGHLANAVPRMMYFDGDECMPCSMIRGVGVNCISVSLYKGILDLQRTSKEQTNEQRAQTEDDEATNLFVDGVSTDIPEVAANVEIISDVFASCETRVEKYLDNVKECLKNEPHVFIEFVQIFENYKDEFFKVINVKDCDGSIGKSLTPLFYKIKFLFRNHQHLIDEFVTFMY